MPRAPRAKKESIVVAMGKRIRAVRTGGEPARWRRSERQRTPNSGARTIEEIAAAADISTETLSRIEAGRTAAKIDTLARIADALDVTIADLLPREHGQGDAKRAALDDVHGFLMQFSAAEIRWVGRVLRELMAHPR